MSAPSPYASACGVGGTGYPPGPPRGARSHSSQTTACGPPHGQFLVEHQHISAKVISRIGRNASVSDPLSACELQASGLPSSSRASENHQETLSAERFSAGCRGRLSR